MSGGAYIALSGLRYRSQQLDRVASDIANASTAGYKSERSGSASAERSPFQAALDAAVDVTTTGSRIDFRPGALQPTGRDLDVAIDGRGFFSIQTPAGVRYTRNGHFERAADGTLTTSDGCPVLGDAGVLRLGAGAVSVDDDGTVNVGGLPVGKLQISDFPDGTALDREGSGRFRAPTGVSPGAAHVALRGGTIEQSNLSVVEGITQLTEISRNFEALNRGVSVLMNDLDARAISELGRR